MRAVRMGFFSAHMIALTRRMCPAMFSLVLQRSKLRPDINVGVFAMATIICEFDETYVCSHCTKYLARDYKTVTARHNYGDYATNDQRASIAEAWRFPIVDAAPEAGQNGGYKDNRVTLVYFDAFATPPGSVGVIGTFANLYEPIPLRRVGSTPYFAITLLIPKGEVHTYQFIVDGRATLDPINPQRCQSDSKDTWSRFFTWGTTTFVTLERWEAALVTRLAEHILPFASQSGRNFLDRYYFSLDRDQRDMLYPNAYRFDENVGVVNYIDKILAREELHHLPDYRVCLAQLERILRKRDPVTEPTQAGRELYMRLYDQMGTDQVGDWDYSQYQSPRYFLQLLRRHVVTGAFSHPKYGGNAGGAGWAYLEDRYRRANDETLFAWRKHQEPPLGESSEYVG